MIFDTNVIDDDGNVLFKCSGIDREPFNQYFIESCKIGVHGEYNMTLCDYKHAIVRLWEKMQ